MARFRFPLDNVIKVRKTAEELAQRDFQVAQGLLHEAIQELEAMKDSKSQAFHRRHSVEVEGGAATPALTQIQEFLAGQDIRIARQKEKIQKIETEVERLREILREKAIDLKIIEKLKEKRLAEFKEEQTRREEKQADDQTTTRFGRSRRGDENGI